MEKLNEFTGGYLVEYSEKRMYPEPYGERTKVICSREKLIELLKMEFTYAVWSCNYINVSRYLENHPEEEIELWGFSN